jgi:hypothetical protein
MGPTGAVFRSGNDLHHSHIRFYTGPAVRWSNPRLPIVVNTIRIRFSAGAAMDRYPLMLLRARGVGSGFGFAIFPRAVAVSFPPEIRKGPRRGGDHGKRSGCLT